MKIANHSLSAERRLLRFALIPKAEDLNQKVEEPEKKEKKEMPESMQKYAQGRAKDSIDHNTKDLGGLQAQLDSTKKLPAISKKAESENAAAEQRIKSITLAANRSPQEMKSAKRNNALADTVAGADFLKSSKTEVETTKTVKQAQPETNPDAKATDVAKAEKTDTDRTDAADTESPDQQKDITATA